MSGCQTRKYRSTSLDLLTQPPLWDKSPGDICKNTWVTSIIFFKLSQLHQCDQEIRPNRFSWKFSHWGASSLVTLDLSSEDLFSYILGVSTTSMQPRNSSRAVTNWYLLAGRQVSLLAWWIARRLIDDDGAFDFLIITCSLNPETAVTFTCGHFNFYSDVCKIKETTNFTWNTDFIGWNEILILQKKEASQLYACSNFKHSLSFTCHPYKGIQLRWPI